MAYRYNIILVCVGVCKFLVNLIVNKPEKEKETESV